jgi:uncharacterized protein YodC (DUF2158 family)
MAQELKVGDVVCFKCGGALMTVSMIEVGSGRDQVRCQWFSHGALFDGHFDPGSLQRWTREE